MKETSVEMLSECSRIWLGPDEAINKSVLFRRAFTSSEQKPVSVADITLFADARYHIWFNNVYLGRGPTFFHPHRRPAQRYDLTPYLVEGKNVLAILVYSPGVGFHNYVPAQCPGLVATVDIEYADGQTECIRSDQTWRATEETGWSSDTPRRSWAIDFIESFDANSAPVEWQQISFDDSSWQSAQERPAFLKDKDGIYLDPGLPKLRFTWQPVTEILSFHMVTEPPFELHGNLLTDAFGSALISESWLVPEGVFLCGSLDKEGGGFTLRGLSPEKGAVVCFDLGLQYTGSVSFEMESDSCGSIDIGWSEAMKNGRPQVLRKWATYTDRYVARKGKNTRFPIAFSAGRYILIALRNFQGEVRFRKLGMLASEPDLDWSGHFSCDNARLNQIWQLCERTIRVGTQEALMDCPTREQATYNGDGNVNSAWVGRLTGDYSHWKHLILETFAVQNEAGLIKNSIFSGRTDVIADFSLHAIIGVRDYLRATHDLETARTVLPACRKLMGWFVSYTNTDGLFDIDWEKRHEGIARLSEPERPPQKTQAVWVSAPAQAIDTLEDSRVEVFIDHPGWGCHNLDEPGIDRRGLNAAINALQIVTLRAIAEIMERCGEGGSREYCERADRLAQLCRKTFWDQDRDLFSDGLYNGKLLDQISQQTNTLCLAAELCSESERKNVLERILDADDKQMARSGAFFWYLMFPILAEADMLDTAVRETIRLWGKMLDHDATTVWETFSGDELDSLCHPFACAPVDFLPRYIAGIGDLDPENNTIELKPQLTILGNVQATVLTQRGPVTVKWQRNDDGWHIEGALPDGVAGTLYLPGEKSLSVKGKWEVEHTDERERIS